MGGNLSVCDHRFDPCALERKHCATAEKGCFAPCSLIDACCGECVGRLWPIPVEWDLMSSQGAATALAGLPGCVSQGSLSGGEMPIQIPGRQSSPIGTVDRTRVVLIVIEGRLLRGSMLREAK